MQQTILYNFRRCPYAMRARLAIAVSGLKVELREVELRDKPQSLLNISPKATVPVLQTNKHQVIDESIDIMYWALQHADPEKWLSDLTEQQLLLSKHLIANNDGEFKYFLDRYKYSDRYPEHSITYYRQQAEKTLITLENQLVKNKYLITSRLTFADMAILPFIRQFSNVDKPWFDASPYSRVKQWLEEFIHSDLFQIVMKKQIKWHENDSVIVFPSELDKL